MTINKMQTTSTAAKNKYEGVKVAPPIINTVVSTLAMMFASRFAL